MLLSQKFPLCFCAFVITICSQKSCSEAAGYEKELLMRRNEIDSKLQVFTDRPLMKPQPLEKRPALQVVQVLTDRPLMKPQPLGKRPALQEVHVLTDRPLMKPQPLGKRPALQEVHVLTDRPPMKPQPLEKRPALQEVQVLTDRPLMKPQPLEKRPALQELQVFTDRPLMKPQPREDAINYGNLEISEPGFDFTDEEIQKLKLWPRGVIPYFIDDFSFDKVLRDRLRAFLEHTNTVAGVRFSELSQPPDDDSRWVFFINRRGVLPCADLDFRKFNSTGVQVLYDRLRAFLGHTNTVAGVRFLELSQPPDDDSRWVFFINRRGVLPCADLDFRKFNSTGLQRMVIGYDCMEPGNLAEIALALVGVPPQHNAPNRDEYVEVEKANILPGKEHLFEKFSDSEWLFHEMDYDFTSAGHYGYHKYTANGGATLKPLGAVDLRAGEVDSYSYYDIWKIRMLYNYIQKKNKDDTGACSKLFKPGDKLKDLTSSEDDKEVVKPRPKPSKYTGISEENIPQPDNYEDGDNNNNKENGNNNEPENKITDDSVTDVETNDDSDDKKTSSNEKKKKLKRNKSNNHKQPLAPDMVNLSDIQTDK